MIEMYSFTAILKTLTILIGLAAAALAFIAARKWLAASRVEIDDTTPEVVVSWDDAPALGVLEAVVAVNAVKDAYKRSAELNADAAQWTCFAAIATGIATALAAI